MAEVGITDYAQKQLGDVVFVDLPDVGRTITAGESFGSIESVKAVSELFAPVSGEVIEVNPALKDHPEAVNTQPHDTWMIRVRLADAAPDATRQGARQRSVRRPHQVNPPRMHRLDATDTFPRRHIGPSPAERDEMLEAVGAASLDALIDEAIPAAIRLQRAARPAAGRKRARLPAAACGRSPAETASSAPTSASATTTPSRRASSCGWCMENPGWYTPYTPYQAEIAQGRLESLLNFQTMVGGPDGDGGGQRVAARRGDGRRRGDDAAAPRPHAAGRRRASAASSLVSDRCLPQTLDVLRSRAEPLGIELRVGPVGRDDVRRRRLRRPAAVSG